MFNRNKTKVKINLYCNRTKVKYYVYCNKTKVSAGVLGCLWDAYGLQRGSTVEYILRIPCKPTEACRKRADSLNTCCVFHVSIRKHNQKGCLTQWSDSLFRIVALSVIHRLPFSRYVVSACVVSVRREFGKRSRIALPFLVR